MIDKLFNKNGWALSSRFASISAGCRYLGQIVLASILIVQGEALAQKEPSVDLSPLVAKSTVTSHTDSATEISVVLVLPLRDLQGATDYAERVNTPKDQQFGKYLTPTEFWDQATRALPDPTVPAAAVKDSIWSESSSPP